MSETEMYKRRFERERLARKQAEAILEQKALELYEANQKLLGLNKDLEQTIQIRTQELTNSESKYRHLVENANEIIFNVNNLGNFTFINKKAASQFGYEVEDLIGKSFLELTNPDYKEEVGTHYFNFLKGDSDSDYHEVPVMAKNGETVWLGQSINRLKTEEGVVYFSAVARDITKRKKIENALKRVRDQLAKSEIKYRSIIENMDLGLMEVDNDGIITRVYDRFCKMIGYAESELIGKDAIDSLISEGYREIITEQSTRRLKGDAGAYEVKIKKKDGTEIWALISGAPFYDEQGEVAGTIGIHYDITMQKKMEHNLKLARHNAVKAQQAEKQFLANMSHEIRTPLNAIIGMSHLLRDSELNTVQRDYLDTLGSSASILLSLISDILDISKIDAGTLEIHYGQVDLKLECLRLIEIFKLKSIEKEVEFILDFDGQITQEVITDAQLLSQVLMNLLGNAEKFTNSGSVTLRARVAQSTVRHYKVKFEVIDTGIGIAEDKIDKVFEQFEQEDAKIRSEFGGTGLGLTISQKITALLDGELKVVSEVGKGSTFYFELEFEKTGTIAKGLYQHDVISDLNVTNKSIRILVVEDNAMNLKYITSLLNKWGLEHEVAGNGKEGIEAHLNSSFDIIFMDLQMPVMDGYEASRRIRELVGGNQQIPIVALTASTFLTKKNLALQAGMTDFLSKPFTPEQLALKINLYTDQSIKSEPSTSDYMYNSALNFEHLHRIYGGDLEYARDMFETFVDIIEDEMHLMSIEIETGKRETIRKLAHKIKPTFNMVGLSEIAAQMEFIEENIMHTAIGEMKKKFFEADEELKSNLPVIMNELNNLNAHLTK